MRHSRRYLLTLASMALALMALVVGFNLLVDPYRVYRIIEGSGWNNAKPALANRTRLAKPYQVAAVGPGTIVLGNSRTESGIDPDDPAWSAAHRPVFNLAVGGSDLGLQIRYLQHAMASRSPSTVVVGLDFIDFLYPAGFGWDGKLWPSHPWNFEARLAVSRTGEPQSRWRALLIDGVDTLASLTATRDSMITLFSQSGRSSTRTVAGFNPNAEVTTQIRSEGQAAVFDHADHTIRSIIERRGANLSVDAPLARRQFALLEHLLQMREQADFQLILYIHPYHSRLLSLLDEMGYLALFDTWKHRVVQVVERYRTSRSSAVELWDFGIRSELTSEPVPATGGTELVYFWESGHYKAAAGHRLLLGMLHGRTDVGAIVDAATIDAHLLRVGHRTVVTPRG